MHFLFHSRDHETAPTVEPVPTVFPVIDGVDVAAVFAGKRLAGDFYDSIRVSSQRVLIGMLDVAGRREENRKILIAAQSIFRTLGSELFSPADINEANAMTELSLQINRGLIETAAGVLSCPAFIACYHERFGTLCYTNAGHTPALLRHSTGIAELASTGLPLGLFSHATSESRIVGLEKGAALILVSRGIVDCESHGPGASNEFGLEGVKRLLQKVPDRGAKSLCEAILGSVAEFGGDAPPCDDRTVLALVRTA